MFDGGVIIVICVLESTVTEEAVGLAPADTANLTVGTKTPGPEKLVPVITNIWPPVAGPKLADMLVIVGIPTYDISSAVVLGLVPPAAVTAMSTVPTGFAGDTAVICVSESTVNEVAAVPPKVTDDTPTKLVPVITTDRPPASTSQNVDRLVIVGGA